MKKCPKCNRIYEANDLSFCLDDGVTLAFEDDDPVTVISKQIKIEKSDFFANLQPKILSVLRFMAGFMMLWHGSQKLFNFPASERAGGELSAFMLVGAILEFGGGILIALGLFTRWAAFILSGTMAVAYWMFHGTGAFLPLVNKGELAVLYCFVFLYLFFAGGGEWSLDNLLKKKV